MIREREKEIPMISVRIGIGSGGVSCEFAWKGRDFAACVRLLARF